MKVRNSLRSLKNRHRDCRIVRRKGRVYVINKTQPRFQGPPRVKRCREMCVCKAAPARAAFSFGSALFVKSIGSLRNALCKATHGPRHHIKQGARKNAQKVCRQKLVKLGP